MKQNINVASCSPVVDIYSQTKLMTRSYAPLRPKASPIYEASSQDLCRRQSFASFCRSNAVVSRIKTLAVLTQSRNRISKQAKAPALRNDSIFYYVCDTLSCEQKKTSTQRAQKKVFSCARNWIN